MMNAAPSVILPPRLGLELTMYDGVTDLVDLQDGKRLGDVERDMRSKPVCLQSSSQLRARYRWRD